MNQGIQDPTATSPATDGTSAVDFATERRVHIGLPVRDLDASVRYYTTLLGAGPSKQREGYAKFEVAEPPLNLSLNVSQRPEGEHPTRHFGVQVKSTAEVVAAHGKLRAAGFATFDEEGVTCCFAVQDKVWSVDPDGNRWEVFVVLDDGAEAFHAPAARQAATPETAGGASAGPRPECCT